MRRRWRRVRLRTPGVVVVTGLATWGLLRLLEPEPVEQVFVPFVIPTLQVLDEPASTPLDLVDDVWIPPARDGVTPAAPPAEELHAPQAGEVGQPLAVSVAAPAEAFYGEWIDVRVTVRNTSAHVVELPQLVEDRQVLTLELTVDDRAPVLLERIHTDPDGTPRTWPTQVLAPGQATELELRLPALFGGRWSLVARLGGVAARGDQPAIAACVSSPALTLVVTWSIRAPRVWVQTSAGGFAIELHAADAPASVIQLVRLVDAGFYDGLSVHRIVEDFVVQWGCPQGDGTGGAGWSIPSEFPAGEIPNRLLHREGTVAIARGPAVDSGSSQLYVSLGEYPHLDGHYTVIGQVTHGLDVIRRLGQQHAHGPEVPCTLPNEPRPPRVEWAALQ